MLIDQKPFGYVIFRGWKVITTKIDGTNPVEYIVPTKFEHSNKKLYQLESSAIMAVEQMKKCFPDDTF